MTTNTSRDIIKNIKLIIIDAEGALTSSLVNFDLNGNILEGIVDNSFRGFSLLDNQLILDPQADLEAQGYLEGQYNTVYNFLRRRGALPKRRRNNHLL
jgi:hypothetical protein